MRLKRKRQWLLSALAALTSLWFCPDVYAAIAQSRVVSVIGGYQFPGTPQLQYQTSNMYMTNYLPTSPITTFYEPAQSCSMQGQGVLCVYNQDSAYNIEFQVTPSVSGNMVQIAFTAISNIGWQPTTTTQQLQYATPVVYLLSNTGAVQTSYPPNVVNSNQAYVNFPLPPNGTQIQINVYEPLSNGWGFSGMYVKYAKTFSGTVYYVIAQPYYWVPARIIYQ